MVNKSGVVELKTEEALQEVEICSWRGTGRSGAADFPSSCRLPQDCGWVMHDSYYDSNTDKTAL